MKGESNHIEKLGESSGRICQNWKKAESTNLGTMPLQDNVWEKKVSYFLPFVLVIKRGNTRK